MTNINTANVTTLNNYWIETATGRYIDFLKPDPGQIVIEDIAWALSRLPRFVGHTSDWQPLSVAAHSMWVAAYVYEKTGSPLAALHGLLHDAHKAFTGDIPGPLKMIPAIRAALDPIEARLQFAICKALQLPALVEEHAKVIEQADCQALAKEARHHLQSGAKNWEFLPAPDDTAINIQTARPSVPQITFNQFMEFYKLFYNKLKKMH